MHMTVAWVDKTHEGVRDYAYVTVREVTQTLLLGRC